MKMLILGGTRFVGRAVVAAALGRGHELTLFHRGRTKPHLFLEAEHVHGDRERDLSALAGRSFDAVVDTSAYTPEVVRASVAALPGAHYVFVSTISVYADFARGPSEDSPVRAGGDVVAPEPRDARVQVIDVRDLAERLVASAESRLAGVFNARSAASPGLDPALEEALIAHEVAA